MALSEFDWTARARPVVELGVGDTRVDTGLGRWDTSKWDDPAATWSGAGAQWRDISCECISYHCEYGRQRTTERFVPGTATVVVDNATGWADPFARPPGTAEDMRPGRSIRMGVAHQTLGTVWLFYGFVDALQPVYSPVAADTVAFQCIDALGEVNRAKVVPLAVPAFAGDWTSARVARLLDTALWPAGARDISADGTTLGATDLGGQLADMLGQTADSAGGSIWGDRQGRVTYRYQDWQTWDPATPPDGTIGNVDPADVCPVQWERPFDRADFATRVIIGRDLQTAQTFDDLEAQRAYGIEPFERTDLLTQSDQTLTALGQRILLVRAASTAPRVRTVTLSAATSDAALDLMTKADVYKPSRYRCRLQYPNPRGPVFDAQHLATALVHDVTSASWSLQMNLDLAAPWQATGGRWDSALWDSSLWATTATELLREALALRAEMEAVA